MKTSDITLSVLIILIFILLYVFNILAVGIKQVQNDWPNYRCNPTVMPFASVFGHDTASNFTYCIQNMQSNYMGYLMQPLHYNFSVIGNISASLTQGLSDVRAFFNNIRNYVTSIVQSIFGVFLNILIEFQRVTIDMKDLFGKLIGIMATLMYTLTGAIMTMKSAWAGPPGQLTRALCFHPETKIKLKDGSLVAMKDVPLNAILKNGSKVCAVMNISNLDETGKYIEQLYELEGENAIDKDDNTDKILVSGSHLVYEKKSKKFIPVEDLREIKVANTNSENLTCLITSDHIIPIGKWIFHDWEDNNGSIPKKLI
jgi:hypothetical protein